MDILKSCAEAYSRLLDIEYKITLGRKGTAVNISLSFDKADFHHLAGLQKLKDIEQLRSGKRESIFNKILDGSITQKDIEKSSFYDEMRDRLSSFQQLEIFLDKTDLYFRYDPSKNKFSVIDAEFVIQGEIKQCMAFLFIDKRQCEDVYFARTFFPRNDTEYMRGQTKYTLLRKEKHNTKTGVSIVQYDRLTPKN